MYNTYPTNGSSSGLESGWASGSANDLESVSSLESGFIDNFESGSGDNIDDVFEIISNISNLINKTNISLSHSTHPPETNTEDHGASPLIILLVLFSPCICVIFYFVLKCLIEILYNIVIAILEKKNKLSNKIKEYYTNKNLPIKNQKLSNKFIKKLNNNNKDNCLEITECSICLNEIDTSKNNLVYLDCQHVFHQKCIQPWVKNKLENIEKPDCPLCRKVIINIPDIKPQVTINYIYSRYSDSDSDYSYSDY